MSDSDGYSITGVQLLSANLEEADPAVYEILQRVRDPEYRFRGKAEDAYGETRYRRKGGRNIS